MFRLSFSLRILLIAALLAHFATLLPAQTRKRQARPKRRTPGKVMPPTTPPIKYPIISNCLLNGKALHLEKPEYPALAKAARAAGIVRVAIETDATGQVVTARALSGHPLLYAVAVKAALKSCYAPTVLSSGKTVKIVGIIDYNFIAQ